MAKKKTAKKKAVQKKTTPRTKTKRPTPPKPLGTCFVMMPFAEPFETYYNKIFCPAIIKTYLAPVRADDLFRPSVIVSDIWQMIRDAKLLLAEMTNKNANVFYELGLAHAIGKPVVLVSKTEDEGSIPSVRASPVPVVQWPGRQTFDLETRVRLPPGIPVDS